MTYTKKMHLAARRETEGKHNVVTDLLDEIEKLRNEILAIPCLNFLHADRYDTDDKHILHFWIDGSEESYDIQMLKLEIK